MTRMSAAVLAAVIGLVGVAGAAQAQQLNERRGMDPAGQAAINSGKAFIRTLGGETSGVTAGGTLVQDLGSSTSFGSTEEGCALDLGNVEIGDDSNIRGVTTSADKVIHACE